MDYKRVSLFAGHYGSGKTNIAVNWAFKLKELGNSVTVADLDIVNPYFRTKDSERDFEKKGIKLISSQFASSNVDLPALPQELYSVVDDKSSVAVLDVGGDERGALALGRYTPAILEENDYEMFFVVNWYRPCTRDVEATLEVKDEIEAACGIKFTAIVNNSNLGEETTAQDVLNSMEYVEELSKVTGLKIKMTTVMNSVYNELEGKIDNLFPMELQEKIISNK